MGQLYNDMPWLFRGLALHLQDKDKLEEKTSTIFNLFTINSEGDLSKVLGTQRNNIRKVEDILS